MGVDGFARRDGSVQRRRNLRLALVTVADDRFLEPRQVQLLHHASQANGLLDAHWLVGVDHQADIRADRLPHRRDACHHFLGVGRADAGFHGVEAALHEAGGLLLQRVDGGSEP